MIAAKETMQKYTADLMIEGFLFDTAIIDTYSEEDAERLALQTFKQRAEEAPYDDDSLGAFTEESIEPSMLNVFPVADAPW